MFALPWVWIKANGIDRNSSVTGCQPQSLAAPRSARTRVNARVSCSSTRMRFRSSVDTRASHRIVSDLILGRRGRITLSAQAAIQLPRLVLLTANTVTYRRSPGPALERRAPRRCRLALTPGRPPQTGGLRAGDGLAGYPCAAWVWRGVSDRPGGPGSLRLTYTSPNLRPRLLSIRD
jgi:hypothetical protein